MAIKPRNRDFVYDRMVLGPLAVFQPVCVMNNEIFWLLTLVILCVGFSIQPLRELWRKMRHGHVASLKNSPLPVASLEQIESTRRKHRLERLQPSSERESILYKYKIPF